MTSARWYRHLLTRLLTVQERQAPWTVALRNTVGVVLPLAVGVSSGHIQAGLGMTVGALTVMFSDQPGSYAARFRRLLLASGAGALAALVGFSLGGNTALILPLVGIWTFAAGLMVALGAPATRVGLTSIIVLLITASRAAPASAVQASLLIFAGGLLQTMLAVLLWPVDRDRPQRLMLAEALRSLADTARELPEGDTPPPESSTMNELQSALLGQSTLRNPARERFCLLVHEYDQIRLALVTLSEQLSKLSEGTAQKVRNWMLQVAQALENAADAIAWPDKASSSGATSERMDFGLESLQQTFDQGPQEPGMRPLLDSALSLARHVRVVGRNCRLGRGPEVRSTSQTAGALLRVPRAGRPLDTLRANLRWHAIAFRHALRCAVAVMAGLAIARFYALEHGYWIAMTAAIVLKPDFGATISYGILRMLGTLVGLLVMSLLLDTVLISTGLRVAAMAVLCFAFREMAPRHYGIGVAALSGMLVLMLALAGEPAMQLVVARATGTAGGCLLGLAAYLAWPSWERGRVRPSLAGMLSSWSGYLYSLRDDDEAAHGEMRRAARTARSNAQASLDRLREEPRTGEGLLRNGEEFFVAGNRLARAVISLDALLLEHPETRGRASLQDLLQALAEHAQILGARMNGQPIANSPIHDIGACAATLRDEMVAVADDSGLCELVERLEMIAMALDSIVEKFEEHI
ncbi:MAG: FUSC family protein [Rhodanobacteraceae bacterium]